MPNHFHAILIIGHGHGDARHGVPPFKNKFGPQSNNLASIIRGFKSAVTTQVKKSYSRRDAMPSGDARHCVQPSFKWQSGFHDHIIRNAESFARIEKYIMNNPGNWKIDEFL